jgi:hypothetical protein
VQAIEKRKRIAGGGAVAVHYRAGDRLIYTYDEYSQQPAAWAKNVRADRRGEGYRYEVDTPCIVTRVLADGSLEARTPNGHFRVFAADDMQLRRATLLDWLLRFTQATHGLPSSSMADGP